MSDVVFCGVEGGGTHSVVVLYNGFGECLSSVHGPASNYWIGMDEVRNRIIKMVEEAKQRAGVSPDTQIKCICMSLSGGESASSNEEFKAGFKDTNLAEEYMVCSDTRGPIAAVNESGGVVLIAGTGSNALLENPDGSTVRCGGWGHILGDEGSAYGISHMAIKVYFDDIDGLRDAPNGYSTEVLWNTIQNFFNVKSRAEILPHIYKDFEKNKFSKLCKHLAEIAKQGDPLCCWIFIQAGKFLAQHLLAIYKGASDELLKNKGGLAVVCVGSVWRSWELLKPGFLEEISSSPCKPKEFSLLTLADDCTAAKGAVYLASRHVNFTMPKDYSSNYSVFHHYKAV
uniref:N-acetyl-D-glucosamine kinase n=1 Tax=Lygus hesperus TaxID=30085 RepID=A0A0A9YC15_LYGHE